jgi:transcription-repair coupling factor (superfamily II helicase)
MMPEAQRWTYFKEKREAIMAWVEDEDVKSAISKEFTAYKSWEVNVLKQLDKLQEITKKQELIKSADEKANQLMDQMKEQLEWIVNDKQDEIVWEMWDKAKERLEKNWWDDVKHALGDLDWAMKKYEKWSKMYEDAKWKYDKLKKVYDEVMWVYNRIDDVNKMLAEWKIDAWKAKVIKWAVLLDKWLEYATSYVPVFGSTISTVSKETFWVVIELAKKRAERSTALDKCFTDPANCDTDKISGY